MRRILLFFSLFLLLVGCQPDTHGEWVTVKRVVDGDTFELTNGEKVRLIGVDTPETVKPNTPVQPYGKEASDFTKKMLTGKKIRLETDVQERDKYGRILAYAYLEDGTFFNELLLREGYAQIMTVPPNVKYADHFRSVQQKAREQGKGLWGLENSNDLDKLYVDENGRGLIKGNINSKGEKIYHLPGDAAYDQTKPEEWFRTEKEAIEAGYRKAKR
jgi:micrococcal nuclease